MGERSRQPARRDAALTLAPRSYRPSITARARTNGDPATGDPATGDTIPATRTAARPDRTPLFAALAIVLTMFAALGYWASGAGSTDCRSARPYLILPDGIAGDGDAVRSAAAIRQLEAFLMYYPLIDGVVRGTELCPGVPVFALDLTRDTVNPATVLASASLDRDRNRVVWQDQFALPKNPTESQRDLAMAQIAYALAAANGRLPAVAAGMRWDDRAAFPEYACVNRAHRFFVATTRSDFATAHACLSKHIETSRRADVAGLLAALESDTMLTHRTGVMVDQRIYDRAVARAEAIDANNSELLMAELRHARSYGTEDLLAAQGLIARMLRAFPYEPHVVFQVALTQSMFTGQFERAAQNLERAEQIVRDSSPVIRWPFVYHAVAAGDYAALASQIPELEASDLPFAKLALMLYGESSGDAALIAAARRDLLSGVCNTYACVTD